MLQWSGGAAELLAGACVGLLWRATTAGAGRACLLGLACAFMGPRTVALRLVHVLLLLSLVCLQVPDCRSWVAYSGGTMVVVPEFTLGGLGPSRASL